MTDHSRRPLYVQRSLLNPEDIEAWARQVGFKNTLDPQKMHVTIAFSRKLVDWSRFEPDQKKLKINGGHREMKAFGAEGKSIVLVFESHYLQDRWRYYMDGGCSYDFPKYIPHVSITYEGLPPNVDLKAIVPYDGQLRFGHEEMDVIKENP